MDDTIRVELLAAHRDMVPVLRDWFEAEWPAYYGPGGRGNALHDLQAYANEGRLPVGVVAFRGNRLCGIAALKADSIASHAHLSPWAAAGLVHPALRRQGIGRLLIGALEEQARTLGFPRIYCGTSTAERLLERCHWQLLERVDHEGQPLAIYSRKL